MVTAVALAKKMRAIPGVFMPAPRHPAPVFVAAETWAEVYDELSKDPRIIELYGAVPMRAPDPCDAEGPLLNFLLLGVPVCPDRDMVLSADAIVVRR